MPPPTNTERIARLETLGTEHEIWLDVQDKAISAATERQGKTDDRVSALERRLDVLEHKVEELRKESERWGGRIWALAGPLVGATAAVLGSYLLKR